ncbi:hypothetical protein Pint_08054 [Pistacia integerrima]|uniref:Uncharacterized protein n=1 Tax=Pistacia integerrima TaxID=434235 RepID=A0ACC0XV41_9ROSI|nr:hypothetical protein Pint_08054 [Pistacia integerrima]
MGLRGVPLQLVLLQILLRTAAAATIPLAKPGCEDRCGGVEIPYPFGTTTGCFLNDDFLITCNNSFNPPQPFLRKSKIPVTNITIDGRLHVMSTAGRDCYEGGKRVSVSRTRQFSLSDFSISNTENKFTVIGCDSYAYIRGYLGNQTYRTGCMSLCENIDYVQNGTCAGIGCCQVDIPKGLKRITFTPYSQSNHTNVSDFNPCTFAFIVEQSQFSFSSNYLLNISEKFPAVIDWTISGNGSCENASRTAPLSYACKENSECYDPDEGDSGYRCRCKTGYEGNPYLSNGCQDIDECNDSSLHNCEHICDNQEGSYTCQCRKGYHGDGRKDGDGCIPNQFSVVKVTLGVGISIVILLVSSSWLYLVLKKRRLIKLKEKFFQQNGGFLLQQQLSKRSGSSDATKIFTAEELKKATNNYADARIIGRGGYGTVYKGFLADNGPIAIKKSKIVDQSQIEQFVNEGGLFEILESDTVNDEDKDQLKEVAEVAKMCLRVRGEERPTMREVAMALDGLKVMPKHAWDNAELISEETKYLLCDTPDVNKYGDGSTSTATAGYDSIRDQIVAAAFDNGR